ncbi:hypothetical protein [Thermoleophilum album]|uniref:Uncharacterized protein n=1 Tax=Thermoleophilum album TaxID=29539 RepID=A0A1H6FXT6_THEAL|nr:hypothetical protein [Thermoleophilum album]SEH14998.1 hypothetical protein SAMN02745716_1807 [Thermoleophilum album]
MNARRDAYALVGWITVRIARRLARRWLGRHRLALGAALAATLLAVAGARTARRALQP